MGENFIPDIVLQDNTNQRLPCILVLDGSSSMSGDPINELNKGLKVLESELKADDVACQRVQLLVIRIGDYDEAEIISDWTDAIDFHAPRISANGTTPLGKGVKLALKKLEEQKKNYKDHQIQYNRPWLFIFTDGEPNDRWESAAKEAVKAESDNKAVIFCIGTEGANFDILGEFSNRDPMKLNGLQFEELFLWLSKSASSTSKAAAGSVTQLAAVDWGSVPTQSIIGK